MKGLDLTIGSVTWHRSCDIGYRIGSKPISMIHESKETTIRNMLEETISLYLEQLEGVRKENTYIETSGLLGADVHRLVLLLARGRDL